MTDQQAKSLAKFAGPVSLNSLDDASKKQFVEHYGRLKEPDILKPKMELFIRKKDASEKK